MPQYESGSQYVNGSLEACIVNVVNAVETAGTRHAFTLDPHAYAEALLTANLELDESSARCLGEQDPQDPFAAEENLMLQLSRMSGTAVTEAICSLALIGGANDVVRDVAIDRLNNLGLFNGSEEKQGLRMAGLHNVLSYLVDRASRRADFPFLGQNRAEV